jgi:hypothetical protein
MLHVDCALLVVLLSLCFLFVMQPRTLQAILQNLIRSRWHVATLLLLTHMPPVFFALP